MKRLIMALYGAVMCIGCVGPETRTSDDDADEGAGGSGMPVDVGSGGAATTAGFDAVFAPVLVDRGCVYGCHDASALGGLMLKASETGPPEIDMAYASLVGPSSTSLECNGWPRVVPNAPQESLLWLKMAAELGVAGIEVCGEPMPKGANFISMDDLMRIETWILEGAPR